MKNIKSNITLILSILALTLSIGSYQQNIKAAGNLNSQGKIIYENNGEEVIIDTNDNQLLKNEIEANKDIYKIST